MPIDGVVFDLDGTLLNTIRDIAEAANTVLRMNGFSTHDVESYRYFVGEGVSQLFYYILPEPERIPSRIDHCCEQFRENYETHWNVHTAVYPGVDDLLRELSSRSIRLTVLSNKPHRFTQKCVEHYLSRHRFDAVYGQRDDVPRKPDPAGALEIASELGLPPSHFLYLGDTAIDMLTAERAQMYGVGALWGFRGAEELQQNGARVLIDQPGQLLDVLASLA